MSSTFKMYGITKFKSKAYKLHILAEFIYQLLIGI